MPSGRWSFGDSLVALGVLMLLLEVIKGARPGAKYLTDHILSLIVFGAAAAEFLMWSKFAQLDLFSADPAGDDGLPVRDRVARAPQQAGAGGCDGIVTPIVDEPVDDQAQEPASIDPPPALEDAQSLIRNGAGG